MPIDFQLARELTSFCGQRQIGPNVATVFKVDCPLQRCHAMYHNSIPLAARRKYGYRVRPCWYTGPCPPSRKRCCRGSPCCRRYF